MMTAGLAIMTNLFQERYYRINKTLLILIGGWPYLTRTVRSSVLILILCFSVSAIIPQVIAVSEVINDWDVAVESIPPFGIDIAFAIKLYTIVTNTKKMQKILEHIRIDWISLAGQPELRILHEYAEQGRQFTIAYAIGVYLSTILFMMQPVVTKIFQVMNPLNDTELAKYPLPANYYGLDTDAYYFYLLPFTYSTTAVILTVIVAADTLFIVQVQHGCAMFSVLGHQLRRMTDGVTDDWAICIRPVEDPAFRHLTACIRNHNEVIEFSDLLESVYSPAFLSSVGLNMILMSITGFQCVVIMNERPLDALRYVVFIAAQLAHLFFQSYFSHKLMDHSQLVRQFLCEAEWYRTTLYAQKLLTFVSMRTLVPCRLTAGKISVMSLETFTSVVKTSMSYFTLLRSMQ